MITINQKVQSAGGDCILFRMQNASGSFVDILNYGAAIVSIVVPDKNNRLGNVVLNYPNLVDYLADTAYLGSTIGRFANRISNAGFELDGEAFSLDKNDGKNTNHGGWKGFNKQFFDYKIVDDSLVLSIDSKDGEGGFPGNLHFSVRYSFNDANELTIRYKGIADRKTIMNPTNHAYFDLSSGKECPLDHQFKVAADRFLEMNDEFLPTGKILPIQDNAAFDFRKFKKIRELMPLKREILKGYNTYFIGTEANVGTPRLLASLKSEGSGRCLEVYSDMPGIQFYTGDYLSGVHKPFDGVCLEAQFYPDAPHHSHFPSCILEASKEVTYTIRYKFFDSKI